MTPAYTEIVLGTKESFQKNKYCHTDRSIYCFQDDMKKNQKIRTQWAWKFEMVVKIKKEMTPVSAAGAGRDGLGSHTLSHRASVQSFQ